MSVFFKDFLKASVFLLINLFLIIGTVNLAIAEEYDFHNYSIKGPEGSNWEIFSTNKDIQQIIFRNKKNKALITVLYEPILDPDSFSRDIKTIADNKRKGEIAVMQNDPNTPVKEETIRYDEETIAGRKYYTMSYVTATRPKQYGHLYFHISDDRKNMYPAHLNIVKNRKHEEELFYVFKEVLKSLKIHSLDPYDDAINRAGYLVLMFSTYAQQYDLEVHGEDIKKQVKRSYDLAMDHISKALELNPKSSEAHFLLGILYEFNGNMVRFGENFPADMAISEYKKAIEINPEYEDAYFYLGVVNYYVGDINKAIANYKKVLELSPTNNTASLNLYSAYEKKGMTKEAIDTLEQTLEYWIGSKEGKREIKNKIRELKKSLN